MAAVIDNRSHTATQPTAGMRAAIAAAVVGDEQRREDPTVLALETRAASLLGQEEGLFLPTATMANQIALRLHGEPGDELLAEEGSHVLVAELGGPAANSGLVTRALVGAGGRFTPEQVRAAVRRGDPQHVPRTRIVVVENTHNTSGGRVWRLDELDAVTSVAAELELRVHLDGARLFNAAAALGVPAARVAAGFDTVTLCLSKGLGCPLGAVLAGSAELMARARRLKHLFGGAMRQAGIVAAAGVYALDHHVERLVDDHARARLLAERLAAAALAVDVARVETNFVQLDVAPLGLSKDEAIARIAAEGIGVSATVLPTVLRAVTHLGIGDDDIAAAAEAIPRALGVLAPA
jgi:threonine aldolase